MFFIEDMGSKNMGGGGNEVKVKDKGCEVQATGYMVHSTRLQVKLKTLFRNADYCLPKTHYP